jgi:hypothetical protein
MMRNTASPTINRIQAEKFILPAAIFLFSILIGLLAFQAWGGRLGSFAPGVSTISESTLADRYGLRVSLIGVTAAGGMLDFRMKMVDAAKARLLLGEAKNFPVLVSANGQVLTVPVDNKPATIEFKQDANFYLMFSNTGGVVTSGSTVTVRFGNIDLGPLAVK